MCTKKKKRTYVGSKPWRLPAPPAPRSAGWPWCPPALSEATSCEGCCVPPSTSDHIGLKSI